MSDASHTPGGPDAPGAPDLRADVPRVVTSTLARPDVVPPSGGAVWSLRLPDRDLDSNVVVLPAGGGIGRHLGPEVDVMFHVLDGSATIETAGGDVPVVAGDVVWLPKRSERRIVAGPDGVRYLTVHRHREGLALTARTPV
ncbi:MAG TPA: cupin domain-containing protein [Luteimicrobium sp.]|nr:cupin domain-containing protein [Luteimicrobium sp.]